MGDITDGTTFANTDRTAAYNIANTGGSDSNGVPAGADTLIIMSIGDGSATPATPATGLHTLSEDEKEMVAGNHDWEGKRYADPAGGDMVEAIVYSYVGEAEQGEKFNVQYTDLDATTGRRPIDTSTAAIQALM